MPQDNKPFQENKNISMLKNSAQSNWSLSVLMDFESPSTTAEIP